MSAADVSSSFLTPDSLRQRYKAEFSTSCLSCRPAIDRLLQFEIYLQASIVQRLQLVTPSNRSTAFCQIAAVPSATPVDPYS